MAVTFKGSSEYTKEFRDPKRRHRNPDEEPFAGQGTPNLDMNAEPPLQRKKRFDGFQISKSSMEPPLQRKKRSDSASPIRQVLEPELQRKKKPIVYKKTAPIATQHPSTGNQHDDYVLLGDQSKFNENVKYRIRSRSAHEKEDRSSREHHHQRQDKVVSHPNHSSDLPKRPAHPHDHPHDRPHDHPHDRPHDRPHNPVPPHEGGHHRERQSRSKERGPPPKVVIDTGKPTRVTGKGDGGLKLDLARERSPSQKVIVEEGGGGHERRLFTDHNHNHNQNQNQKGILRKSAATQSTPRLYGQDESAYGSNGLPSSEQWERKGRSGVPSSQEKTEKRQRDEERPTKKLEEEKRRTTEAKSAANQERATKAASSAAATALPPNYSVKYRLGIAPHRSNGGPIRFSEYQREFQWRDPIKSSPLMSAETVVYNSHPDLTLFRSSSMAEDSEYKAQFKAWNPSEHEMQNKNNDPPPHSHNKHPPDHPKKAKIKRSKSLKEMPTQSKLRNGVVVSTAATDSRNAMITTARHAESDDGVMTTTMTQDDGRPTKKYRSEYSRNFMAPWNYLYDEGAWKKVHAKEDTERELHARPSTAPPHPPPASSSSSSASWYAEVLELRRFADEYRKRAQGTHFSREHLAQLYAKNAELWDTLSNGSVLSSRPSPEEQKKRLHPNTSAAKRSVEKTQKQFGMKSTPLLSAENEISARSESITPNGSSYSEAEKENDYPLEKNRPPPIQHQHHNHQQQQQHHQHHQQQQQRKRPHLTQASPGGIQGQRVIAPSRDFEANNSDNYNDSSHEYNSDPYEGSESSGYGNGLKETKAKGRTYKVNSSNNEKTRNPMKSTQVKSNSSSSVNRPSQLTTTTMKTTMKTHGLPTRDTHVLVSDNNGQGEGDQHHRHRDERQWKTGQWKKTGHHHEDKSVQIQEEDLMSVSSLASSCSLASEVLERARNRLRDDFWK